ncbi:efflux transporter outer membrane subunit [Sphingomonas sp. TREG-RG-20F-R18-01]|uniref:efflux transporter outer membrane subunit n=1 Tax=Sphingomonas sp. TREG-RG-20F-R18-01 TaxID=2914982 RepID=UPI001F59FB6B|nr:efflux transporter outer membrane subunit [Sphingomonas sp. TREG-RG-20F-R18-01]
MRQPFLVVATAALLSGCNLAPVYVRPAPPVAPSFPTGPAYAAAASSPQTPLAWRDVFTDPSLRTIIDRALTNNRDLRAAVANIAAARAQYRVQRASQLPTVSASGGPSLSRGGNATGAIDSYSADVGVSGFEIDLFGRLKNLSKAAFETYLATEAGARNTRLALIAETATAYATLAADQDLLAVAQDTVASTARSLRLTRSLNDAGLTGKVDVRSIETTNAQSRSDVENATTQVAQDRNALDLLVGAPVEDALLPGKLDSLLGGITKVPVGVSSEALLRRPDVIEAEHALIGANANIGAARAAFFPTITLTSAVGFASTALSSLFSGGAFSWSGNSSASVPIFGGTNRGNLAYSEAQRDLYLAQYEKAVQSAFREVADALARAGTIERQQAAQADLLRASGQANTLAEARYREGIDTYLSALVTQRTYYTARQTKIATDLAAVSNRVTLYQVLGGDTEGEQSPSDRARPLER